MVDSDGVDASVRTLPIPADRDEFDALIVRTDYSDEEAWQGLKAALRETGDGRVHFVDDPVCAGAGVEEVLAAVAVDEGLSVVFLADAATMRGAPQALLAVTVDSPEELGEEEYAALTEFGREFRAVPSAVHGIFANVQLCNMGFEEYAEAARSDPEGIFRTF